MHGHSHAQVHGHVPLRAPAACVQAVGASEGFGILTAASVAPIISTLLTYALRKPMGVLMGRLKKTVSQELRSLSSARYCTVLYCCLSVY